MRLVEHTVRVAAPLAEVEAVLTAPTLAPVLAAGGHAPEAERHADKGDAVERWLRFRASAPGRLRAIALVPTLGWDEESVYTRPARRLEYVVVPREGRLAGLLASKGVVRLEADGPDATHVRLEATVRVRVPGISAWLEPWLAARVRAAFAARVAALAEALTC